MNADFVNPFIAGLLNVLETMAFLMKDSGIVINSKKGSNEIQISQGEGG
jgi:hypothetical protein